MRYRARVIPLREGRRQEDKATWEYTDAGSIAQAGRFLRQRYPYPEYVVEEPVEDPRSKPEASPVEYMVDDIKVILRYERPGVHHVTIEAPGGRSITEEEGKKITKLIEEKVGKEDPREVKKKSIAQYEKEITRAYLQGDNEKAHQIEVELYRVYPKWAIGDVPDKDNPGKGNPGNPHRDLRIKLIQLKADIESAAPELEAMYRGIAEATVAAAKDCDISKTLENYDFLRDVSTMMEKRLSSAEFFDQFPNIMAKTASIEKLIQETIREALVENCKCQFIGGEYAEERS